MVKPVPANSRPDPRSGWRTIMAIGATIATSGNATQTGCEMRARGSHW